MSSSQAHPTEPTEPTEPMVATPIRQMQDALDAAVAEALERKRRLGHYAVSWEGGRVVLRGDDAPADAEALLVAEPTPPWPGPSGA